MDTVTNIIPISGFLLCFIPLIAVIVGFIVAAWYTDRQATSTYARILPSVQRPQTSGPVAPVPAQSVAPVAKLVQPAAAPAPAPKPVAAAPAPKPVVAPPPAAKPVEATPPPLPPAPVAEPVKLAEPAMPAPSPAVSAEPVKLAEPAPTVVPAVAPVAAASSAPASGTGSLYIVHLESDPEGADLDGEYLMLCNSTAQAVNLAGYKLVDAAAKHTYEFPDHTLPAGGAVKLWSKAGTNDANNLYWGWHSAIWNNTGDTAHLLNAAGDKINSFSYLGKEQRKAALHIAFIEFDPPGRDIDGEYVLIRNGTSAPINLSGYKLIDGGAKHVYEFPQVSIGPGSEMMLWSKAGSNDDKNLYWGWRSAIWNNTGDIARLENPAGVTVDSYSYEGKAK